MEEPSKATKSETLDSFLSLGVLLISTKRSDKHEVWDVPTPGSFPRASRGPDTDEFRQATFLALKDHALDRLLTHAEKGLQGQPTGLPFPHVTVLP